MQEDKEAVFDAVDTVKACIGVFIPMLDTITFKKDNMRKSLKGGFLNATYAADYLVKKGVPFREAHESVGMAVNHCIKVKKELEELTLREFKSFNPAFGEDIYEKIGIRV